LCQLQRFFLYNGNKPAFPSALRANFKQAGKQASKQASKQACQSKAKISKVF